MHRAIDIDFDPKTGATTINISGDGRRIGRVDIRPDGDRFAVRGAGSRAVDTYDTIEKAFRNTMRALIEEIQEDLLPTKTR